MDEPASSQAGDAPAVQHIADRAPADQRKAARSSLMLRAAKLLCESGEYVGILRDVSSGGVRLRLFHEPPPETHLFLELGNGDRYAMERVWSRDDHAGFRFSCAIDVATFIQEPCDRPRRPLRLNLRAPAVIGAGGATQRVLVVNLSQHGACIEATDKLALRQQVRLDIAGFPARIGFVRWRRGTRHGLVFQQSLRLDELALEAHALQPFAEKDSPPVEAPLPLSRSA